MRIIAQRTKKSNVVVDDKIVGEIEYGLTLLVGFTYGDSEKEIDYLVNKVINLRVFDDEDGVMNRSLLDVGGSILSISQFTLYADSTNGRRPSYSKALKGSEAKILYDLFNEKLKEKGILVECGVFGAEMHVLINNIGPATYILEKEGVLNEK